MGSGWKGGSFVCAVCVALAWAAAVPASASAQSEGGGGCEEAATAAPSSSVPARAGIFGKVPERRRLIPAFWRTHPFDQKFPHLAYTRGMGLQASGWLAGAFLNSYERLSFIAGVEREWMEAPVGRVARVGVGYRAGLLTGYDERLASWADETPVLPFLGLLGWAQVGRVRVDSFYVYRAITLEGSLAF